MIKRDAEVRTLKDRDVSTVADPTVARIVGLFASQSSIPINMVRQEGVGARLGVHRAANEEV